MRKPGVFLLIILALNAPPGLAAKKSPVFLSPPVSQIQVDNVSYTQTAPDKFLITANLNNPTPETREIVFRGRLAFYDKTAPKGDRPVFVLTKDGTVILRAGEGRSLGIPIINEGSAPRGILRIESAVRVRRQRIWNY